MKIAYIMSRFPLLSETFILREMIEVERQGHQIVLYPIMCETHPVIHDEAKDWALRANCIPFFSREIIRENLNCFIENPLRYLNLWWQTIIGSLSSLNFLGKSLYLIPKAVYTAKRIQADGVDHIHAHYATFPGFEAWVAHQLTGISYSITVHSHDIYDRKTMLKQKFSEATFIVPISKYNVEYMVNLVGDWVRAKCHVVHCGIDPERYMPLPEKITRKSEDPFEIIQIGSLHWKKGQVYLIQAMAMLKERGLNFRMRIIGEGTERPKLEAEIRKRQLASVVELMGAKTQVEVAKLLPTADCYVQSSVSEGIPVALMEAMACGLPVVSTNITGIPELVLNNKTGVLVPPANPKALADAIYAMAVNPQATEAFGQLGRPQVLKEFDLSKNAAELVALFVAMKGQADQSRVRVQQRV